MGSLWENLWLQIQKCLQMFGEDRLGRGELSLLHGNLTRSPDPSPPFWVGGTWYRPGQAKTQSSAMVIGSGAGLIYASSGALGLLEWWIWSCQDYKSLKLLVAFFLPCREGQTDNEANAGGVWSWVMAQESDSHGSLEPALPACSPAYTRLVHEGGFFALG